MGVNPSQAKTQSHEVTFYTTLKKVEWFLL